MIHTTFEGAEYFDSIASEAGRGYGIAPTSGINKRYHGEHYEIISLGYDVLIYLDNHDNFFTLRSNMLNSHIRIEPLHPNFYALVNLTENMQIWSVLFIILTSFIIIVVTIISTVILLNSRKYEIAVLRSVGMKKRRIITNYLIENLAFIWGISVVSLIAAQFISRIFTGRVFEGIQDLVAPEMFRHLTQGANIELLLQNVGLVFAGTTAVVMLSLILACVNIVRLEPLKIFNKQY
jgi:ABC-type antimicrobial peptide transport system permease subunit